ncbi:MAG: hypothetical protein NWE78_03895 [Candidatus Bathyarchaeota archaeon]|nr:hypothetical protein [Candidatus Bathyarchaeota archaeon]
MIPDFIVVWILLGILALVLMIVDPEKRQSHSALSSRRKTGGNSRLDQLTQFSNRSILFLPGGYYFSGSNNWETRLGNTHWRLVDSVRQRRLEELSRRRLYIRNLPTLVRRSDRDVKSLCMNWRRAIAGLLILADRNLTSGMEKLTLERYEDAIMDTAISVENASRALIYCYGGKPNTCSGQEEPLRMLATRFPESEREDFERAVETVARITQNRTVLKNISPGETKQELFGKRHAKELYKSALEVTSLFKGIIEDNFGTEIPELATIKKGVKSQMFRPPSLG